MSPGEQSAPGPGARNTDAAAASGPLRRQDHGPTAVLSIERARNVLDSAVVDALHSVLNALERDPSIRAVVLTGANGRFASGADLGEVRDATAAAALDPALQALCIRITEFATPTIAAVNGDALGGGVELLMACDLQVAGHNAGFAFPEVRLGLLPGGGASARLSRHIGLGRALDLILTSRRVEAGEAFQMGLVSRVVPDEEVLDRAVELGSHLAEASPLALRLAKQVVRSGADSHSHAGYELERVAEAMLYGTDDKREGIEAFFARRAPTFTGR